MFTMAFSVRSQRRHCRRTIDPHIASKSQIFGLLLVASIHPGVDIDSQNQKGQRGEQEEEGRFSCH